MTNDLTTEEIRALLNLEPHDVEALAAKYPDVADDLRAFQQG
jgi:hypothetical protein